MKENLNLIKEALEGTDFFDSNWTCQAQSGDGKWSNWWDMSVWNSQHNHMVSAEARIDEHENVLVKFNLSIPGMHLVQASSIELCLPNPHVYRTWLELDSIGTIISNTCKEMGTKDVITASSMQELARKQKARKLARDRYMAEAKAANPELSDNEARAIAKERWKQEQK